MKSPGQDSEVAKAGSDRSCTIPGIESITQGIEEKAFSSSSSSLIGRAKKFNRTRAEDEANRNIKNASSEDDSGLVSTDRALAEVAELLVRALQRYERAHRSSVNKELASCLGTSVHVVEEHSCQ